MGTVNYGTQSIYTAYQSSSTTEEFNKNFADILKPGIYEGGALAISVGNTITIAPFTALFQTSSGQLVKIKTTTFVTLTLSSTAPYAIGRFTWLNQQNNYADFYAVGSGSVATTDIIFGVGNFTGPNLTGFDYTLKTWGTRDDSNNIYGNTFTSNVATGTAPITVASTTLVTNLNADKLDGSDLADIVASLINVGEIRTWDKTFPSTPALTAYWKECDGTTISDASSPYNGYRIRNLNGANVILSVTWTADGGGAYATVSATDITALSVGDDVTGAGIAANTYISDITGTTVTITDISAAGVISTTFTNDGLFIRGGSASGVGQKDQMQRITGGDANNIGSGAYTGAIDGTANDTSIYTPGSAGTRTTYTFDSSNSPDARTSTDTYGETRPSNQAMVYIMRIK